MSMENYAVFIAPKGSKVEGIALAINKERSDASEVRRLFVKKHKAWGSYGSDYGLRGLIFKDSTPPPLGWRKDTKEGTRAGYVAVPALKTPEGKALQAEIRALPKLPNSDTFTQRIGTDWVTGRSSESRTGLALFKCWYEQIGDTLFVMCPWKYAKQKDEESRPELTEKNRTSFHPEGCEPSSLSAYYAAKEKSAK